MKNPSRYAGKQGPSNTRPIGEPYATMTPGEIEVWNECRENMPWLHAAHRQLLRLVCKLAARMDGGELGVQASSVLSALLSKLGATPVDTAKVLHGVPEEEDSTDAFFSCRTH